MASTTGIGNINFPDVHDRLYKANTSQAKVSRRRLRLLFSYAPDWVLCIVLVGVFYSLDYIDGFEREFDLTDTSIQHSFTVHERIPNSMLLIYAGAAPLLLIPLVNIVTIRSWWDLHSGWLGLLLSLSLTGAVSQVTKVMVGRPRPDLIARCKPLQGSANAPIFGLVTSKICTQTDRFIMRDGFRSFPSAHSSLSFAGLGFLSFYLAGKLHLFDEKGYTGKSWVSLTPLVGAALIAISRTMDYRHHWQDVLTGSTVGIIFAFFSYRQYYPRLSSPLSHRPYSPRIPSERKLMRQVSMPIDEEQGVPSSDEAGRDASNQNARPHHHPSVPHPRVERSHSRNTSTIGLIPPSEIARPSTAHSPEESYEMEEQSIDETVRRPRQDLDQVWRRGASNEP